VLTVVDNVGGVTIEGVKKGLTALTIDTHYTVAEDKVTLKKTYLETLSEGEHIFTIETDLLDAEAVIEVEDTTIIYTDPDSALFDKNKGGDKYDDVVIEIKHNTEDVTLTAVKNGKNTLSLSTEYTVSDLEVTILKEYLEGLSEGNVTITFETSKGNADAVITIDDTTNVYLDPDNGIFDLYSDGANYANVEVEIKHNTEGVTLTAIKNDNNTLALSTHYTVEGLKVTLLIAYLETLTEGDVTLVFETSKGNLDFALTIEDTETEEG